MLGLFLRTSRTVSALGAADLAALLLVTGSISAGALALGHAPPVMWPGILYLVLWWNKAYFTRRYAGGAFPAVFGMGPRGEFNINW